MQNIDNISINADKIRKELEADLRKVKIEEEFRRNENLEEEKVTQDWVGKDYENNYLLYKKRYEAIENSTAWKMTAPLRRVTDIVKHFGKHEQINKNAYRKNDSEKEKFESLNYVDKNKIEIAVHVHLYYEDLLDEFLTYLKNIPEAFDLYISCREEADIKGITEAAKSNPNVNKVIVKASPNRGRDIAPFYALFGKELQKYEYLLHVHTKKSLYTGQEQKIWRQWGLEGVLKSPESVAASLECLRSAVPRGGLVFGEMTPSLPYPALHWLRNAGQGRILLERMGLEMDNGIFFYPVGSFFWAKTKAIQPLFDLKLTYKDFDEENGQIDGTLAHVLERAIACVACQRGYGMYIYNPETESMSLNKSYYAFRDYFTYNVDNISKLLLKYDVITFDIFDTLITRLCYMPDDVFRLMSRLIENKTNKEVDFLKLRKAAEQKANEKYGDFTNIHKIYEMLPAVSDFNEAESEELKQLEIKLEFELCVPRKDVLEIFNHLIEAGKKVILISDMYLPYDIVEKMLYKCGYSGYTDIWISCDKGKRKDRDTIWDEFLDLYGDKQTIHIGDNPHSDYQLIGDRKRNALLLLSSRDEFRLSNQYEEFKTFINGTVEDSILLGYFVNGCLYNSPFALNGNGVPEIGNLQVLIQGIFAPVFLQFMDYVQKSSRQDSKLLFLAREGYFLEKLYVRYCNSFNVKELPHKYFLTSRRSSSVPQIDTYSDIKELLKSSYTGRASNLLKERFGLKLRGKDFYIRSMEKDESKVLLLLSDYIEELLNNSIEEKRNYIEYLKQEFTSIESLRDATLVDVGYAGSIQYYLMKMLHQQLEGCYMLTEYKIKPAAINGICRSLYSLWTEPVFDQTTLFLEAITAAPHGQVIKFTKSEGKMMPVLKSEENTAYEKAAKCQEYIYEYVEQIGKVMQNINPVFNHQLAMKMYGEIKRQGILSNDMKAFFSVNDDYCNDGSWVYSEEDQEWKLI